MRSFAPSCKDFAVHAPALLRSQRGHVQHDNSAHAHTDPAPGQPRMIHLIHAHSHFMRLLTMISLERSGAGCLCRRTAAFGSTISLTCSIAGARAERPYVKLTSMFSPRRELSEQRAELRMRPSQVSASTPDPKSLIRAQDSTEGKLCFQ